MPGDIISTTDRLTLNYFNESKHRTIFTQYRNDEKNVKFQSTAYPYTEKHVDDFFISMKDLDIFVEGHWLQIALEEKTSGEMIGDCAFVNRNSTAEIGITIRPKFQRQGYAKEAISALIDILFNRVKVHRVTATLDVDNVGSEKLMKSLGMRQEAYYVKSYWDERMNEWRDELFFAILHEEYQS